MLKRDFSVTEIARELGFHKSSISREIKRGWGPSACCIYRDYYPVEANKKSIKEAKKRGNKKRIVDSIYDFVVKMLNLRWSPERIAGRYRKEKGGTICHQTIYNFIAKNPFFKKFLRFPDKRGTGRYKQRLNSKNNLMNISTRPTSANNRSRFGHWERDGMYGANKKQVLVCIERKSRLIRLGKINLLSAEKVNNLTEHLLKNEKVITITNDNGTEFRKPKTSKFPIYYCDPMRPNQRGSVENVIGTLRRYITRKTDLNYIDEIKLKEIEDILNQTPRKIFDYLTPYEVYYKCKVALVV